jgi:hypothetical protein
LSLVSKFAFKFNLHHYTQDDPEIMSVFMKLATMFPGATGAEAGMPQMPPQ